MSIANLITLVRVAMIFVAIWLLYADSRNVILLAMPVIVLAIVLDAVDGIVARQRGETSGKGAIMDIAGDRLIESVLWIVFADLRVIEVWVPIVMISRGVIVDAFRGAAYAQGKSAFGANSMMESPIAQFLTSGRATRALYGAAKLVAFAFLAGLVAFESVNGTAFALQNLYESDAFRAVGWISVWLSVALSLIRGVPVVVEAMMKPDAESRAAAEHLARLAAARSELLEREEAPVAREVPL